MSRVFVSQEPMRISKSSGDAVDRFDFTPVEAYGTMILLLEWTEPRRFAWDVLIPKMRERLTDFSDEDYILPVGNPVAIGLAVALAAEANQGRVKVLDWNKRTRLYAVAALDLGSNFLLPLDKKWPT